MLGLLGIKRNSIPLLLSRKKQAAPNIGVVEFRKGKPCGSNFFSRQLVVQRTIFL
jgi:hypothetical protein